MSELSNAMLAQLGASTAIGPVKCTGLQRSDSATPLELETALSTVDAFNVGFSWNTEAAAGTDAASATALTRQVNKITGADGTKGVTLSAAVLANYSHPTIIYNDDTTNTLKVFPLAGTINGGASFLLPAKCFGIFWNITINVWLGGVTNVLNARASADQAAVVTTGAALTSYGYTEAQANSIVTLLNEIRAALIANGTIKGSA